ncbi:MULTISPECIES: DUF6479 family protein [Streptomyces]|jgi:hypothetical protein|uniref:Secreted protein n=1 Tax=Streptomyces thermoviolaceus subsp. thermoviolaceus TaxID=66860 RepID=A0ABX0YM04_STRTL|nr:MULTISPECIES: DUF6479 family protein [Streptomyces]WTD46293.1 DUF6479 family protein [Streptomyces thermoviolaceus]NJP13547.1 hypothetical protein [Streptomyces thermoviolaceus subsp. thermoviolaceus]RSS03560.1 hypothetical protein EF917_13130 [Streptomyces sp. WAC00469]GGV66107.1 hypothetical protein GCM10010499_10980 [Streptomyces thermoviolaceus subsp. apingens]GHA76044.1 hypothetical protein GCM10010512_03090 [Streptomyces thermoviolaceus subsp. thermoviolaceus]
MDTTGYQTVAAGSGAGIALVVIGGLVVVGLLIWAFRFGITVMQRESVTPRHSGQPKTPPSGPVRETRQQREPNEVPDAEETGRRLTPHELSSGTRRSDDQSRPRWDSGSSGSFGSGGSGGG